MIYKGNRKARDLLIIRLTDIPIGLLRQWNKNAHESLKSFIDKYDVSYEKKEIPNDVTNSWNNCRTKYTSQDPGIWFNELYDISLNFKKIQEKYEKYEDAMKAHVSDILPEAYKPIIVSCNINI